MHACVPALTPSRISYDVWHWR